jgi:hypothetical protein
MVIAVAVLMLGVLVDTSYTPRPSNLAPILKRLAKALYSHTATQPHSHTATDLACSDRLQLSYSKLGVRGLFIWHFQQAHLELARQHDSLSSSSAVLGIR